MIKPHPTSKIQHPTLTFLLSLCLCLGLSLLFTGCPDIEEPLECGPHQIEVNGECECEPGYHWNDDHTACLLDTTSHAFDWQVYQLGDHGYLEDVAIVNENDIWVVGHIYSDDVAYGGAHWDGNEWSDISFQTSISSITPYGIWIDDANGVWILAGSIYSFEGDTTILRWQRDLQTSELITSGWGTSSENIYFVGTEGLIVHYNGNEFRRLNSPTEENINDVWGSVNLETSETTVYCVATTLYEQTEKRLLQIHSDLTISDVLDYDLDRSLMTVWFDGMSPVYLGGAGFFQRTIEDMSWQNVPNLPEYFIWDIDGNNSNDIIAVGAYGFATHFNGVNWKVLEELQPNSSLRAVDMLEDVVAIAGRAANIVIIGTRTE